MTSHRDVRIICHSPPFKGPYSTMYLNNIKECMQKVQEAVAKYRQPSLLRLGMRRTRVWVPASRGEVGTHSSSSPSCQSTGGESDRSPERDGGDGGAERTAVRGPQGDPSPDETEAPSDERTVMPPGCPDRQTRSGSQMKVEE